MAKKEPNTAKRPVEKLRSYPVQAAIWKNESENGIFHSVTFSRSYKDGNDYRDVDSFSGTQLLQLSQLAAKAYDRAEELNRDARAKGEDQE
jgi:hypothetical protein